ncbi:hypothetical protein D4764_0113550 [Takifugu flavidus]|uniref:Uncharacterized protein n=1 Tax=Takifugu flavidus TaxID=433684 RepID=A0A5C6MGL8_9TELE|nr:hypothetical protein D4764_0113550 [Takifugu flavidus]
MEAWNMVHSDSMSPASMVKALQRCHTVTPNVSIEVPQEDKAIGTNNSQDPSPTAKGGYPLIHWGKLHYTGTELGSNENCHPCPSPLTIGNSRVVESPTPLKKTGSRALAMR